MLSFNALLQAAGINPAETRLLRHRDPLHQNMVYETALAGDERFEQYQRGQNNPRVAAQLASAKHMASFVVDPRVGSTVFVGVWDIRGVAAGYLADPFRGPVSTPHPTPAIIDAVLSEALSQYRGRLIVEWGSGERAWVQRAERQDKAVVELRREREEPKFPGFHLFRRNLGEMRSIPPSWDSPLRATRGVYLVVHRSGQQYVGSAVGSGGFLERWLGYLNGHGGNVGLRELQADAAEYEVSILETCGSGASTEDVYALESLWKLKLGSRVHGLNRN